MATSLGFPLPLNKTDTSNSTSTSDVAFASLPLLSDGSGGNMHHYFRALPISYTVAPECTENPKLEDFMGAYYQSHENGTEINCNLPPSFSSSPSPSNNLEIQNSYHFMQNHTSPKNPNPTQNPSSVSVYNDTSISGIKSWLRQNTALGLGKQAGPSCQTLSADRNMQFDEVAPVSNEVEPDKLNKQLVARESVPRKSVQTFGHRTSQYRGVTRHRWTGRYEAHLWDNSSRKEGQTRKGRQVYLGGYDKEEKAARSYDLAALKHWGPLTHINFPLNTYEKELEEMKHMSRQEYIAHLRRNSSGFSRGASIYRGVTRHHQHGRWQARIGRVAGNKDLYLGTFSTQEEAAEAYDIAAIKFRGMNAVTNFGISKYDVKRICASTHLIGGDLAKRSPTTSSDAATSAADLVGCFKDTGGEGAEDLFSASFGNPNSVNGSSIVEVPKASYNNGEQVYLCYQPDALKYEGGEASANTNWMVPAWPFF